MLFGVWDLVVLKARLASEMVGVQANAGECKGTVVECNQTGYECKEIRTECKQIQPAVNLTIPSCAIHFWLLNRGAQFNFASTYSNPVYPVLRSAWR